MGRYQEIVTTNKKHHLLLNGYEVSQDFGLMTPFIHLAIIGSAELAILYHDIAFSDMLAIIRNNKDFCFDEKYIAVMPLSDHVKLLSGG